MMLMSIITAAARGDSCASPVFAALGIGDDVGAEDIDMNENANAARSSPAIIKGREYKSIRRLPMRSTSKSASTVKTKFVTATVNDVRVGVAKPTIVNMDAEKYIKEFYHRIENNVISQDIWHSHKCE